MSLTLHTIFNRLCQFSCSIAPRAHVSFRAIPVLLFLDIRDALGESNPLLHGKMRVVEDKVRSYSS
jgi:hypothetical protein